MVNKKRSNRKIKLGGEHFLRSEYVKVEDKHEDCDEQNNGTDPGVG